MKKFAVAFVITLLITACSTGTNTADNSCLSKDKDLKKDDRAEALLVDSVDVFEIMNGDSFTTEEMVNMSYGFSFLVTEEPTYVAYELCDLSEYVFISGAVNSDNSIFYELENEPEYTSGSYTNLLYESEGETLLDVESGKDYAVNVYISDDDKNWEFVSTREFTVE